MRVFRDIMSLPLRMSSFWFNMKRWSECGVVRHVYMSLSVCSIVVFFLHCRQELCFLVLSGLALCASLVACAHQCVQVDTHSTLMPLRWEAVRGQFFVFCSVRHIVLVIISYSIVVLVFILLFSFNFQEESSPAQTQNWLELSLRIISEKGLVSLLNSKTPSEMDIL